jgi:hypothetical protein
MKFEELPYAEQLHTLVTRMRTAYWEGRKYGSKASHDKANQIGLQIDKLTRAENLRRLKENQTQIS